MKPSGQRSVLGWVVLGASALALCGSVMAMAHRVSAFNDVSQPSRWHFEQSFSRVRTFKGRQVELREAKTDSGAPALLLVWGDQQRLIPVIPPIVPNLPDLDGYENAVALLAYAPIKQGDVQVNWQTGEGSSLVVVSRSTAGYTPDTWGAVRVKDWWFDFYELRDDGQIVHRSMQFPDRQGRLPAQVETPGAPIEELKERTWEWQAALFAVPKAQVSRYRFKTDAVAGTSTVEGMRWTLPAAGFSAMGVVLGIVLVGGERVARRRDARAAVTPAL